MAKIPAMILAGGTAKRMGGIDKPLVQIDGQPLLFHILSAIRAQAGPIALNANSDPARFAEFNLPVISDVIKGQLGPLAGLLTAMEWANPAPHVLVVAGDTIGLPKNLVTQLSPAPAYAQSEGRDHPTIGLWPTTLAPELRKFLNDGNRRMMEWVQIVKARGVPLDTQLRNINRPEDLK